MRTAPGEAPVTNEPWLVSARGAGASEPGPRGPAGQILFDSISGCTTFSRFQSAPSAILDDLSFTPGPASSAGAVVNALDFYIRTWGPRPRITVRLTFFDRINPLGEGVPLTVQHDQASQQFLVIENAPVNAGPPGSYLISAALAPFVLHDGTFGLEIAFVDERGAIIPNGTLSSVFPGSQCVATQPVIGSSLEMFWIDNDNGDLTGDGIRYEPADPSMPGNQGDQLSWGGASPADNVLAVRMRGFPIESTTGACCGTAEPFACTLQTAQACADSGGIFIGFGEPCTPVFLCVPAPPNDLCESAFAIAGEGAFPFDTRGASSTGPDDCRVELPPFGISGDVWFRWTAPCSGEFQFATCGQSLTDDRIAVYEGTCEQLSVLGCDDDSCAQGFQSWLALDATGGQDYLIRLGVYPNTPGGQGALSVSRIDGPCPPTCPADFDASGSVELADIFAFLAAWFAQVPEAWFFGETAGGVPSIFAFLAAWFEAGIGPC